MTHSSPSHRRARLAGCLPAATVFVCCLGSGMLASLPAGATDEESVTGPVMGPVMGRETLIGALIPITGDPIERRSVDLRVEFQRNSSALTERAMAQLRELGEALVSDALANLPLGIYGHTDTSGPADFNRDLSERRAQVVVVWLREHFAIVTERFREVRGYGEERPRQNLPPTAPAQRRVEIVTFHDLRGEEAQAGESETVGPVLSSDRSESGIVVLGEQGVQGQEEGGEEGGDEPKTRSGYVTID